ncbi:hypothetical protein [Cysteiniphilum sp. JM-1]|uniref:hypothetical protein n=1 Tax=Cysteiniphilum sp. JM-1 TaxID=2610891 RepID=UPI00124744A6|nr:hypothetical protein [Cysteiniphilum sp. JM-1]
MNKLLLSGAILQVSICKLARCEMDWQSSFVRNDNLATATTCHYSRITFAIDHYHPWQLRIGSEHP